MIKPISNVQDRSVYGYRVRPSRILTALSDQQSRAIRQSVRRGRPFEGLRTSVDRAKAMDYAMAVSRVHRRAGFAFLILMIAVIGISVGSNSPDILWGLLVYVPYVIYRFVAASLATQSFSRTRELLSPYSEANPSD
jgi:hypothetical protein